MCSNGKEMNIRVRRKKGSEMLMELVIKSLSLLSSLHALQRLLQRKEKLADTLSAPYS